MAKQFKPGEKVPHSGQYGVVDPHGGKTKREITATAGKHFPPSPKAGQTYVLVDPTKHKSGK